LTSAGHFDGTAYWLEIAVRRTGSGGDFNPLTPLQALTPRHMPSTRRWPRGQQCAVADGRQRCGQCCDRGWDSNGTVTPEKLPRQVVKTLNGLTDAVTLAAGSNVA